MKHRLVIALGLTTCLTTPAAAETWFSIENSEWELTYGDADSIVRNGNAVTLGILMSHAPADYHKQKVEIDCTTGQYRLQEVANLDSKGAYLATPEFDSAWQALATRTDQLLKFACEGAERTIPISDPFFDAEEFWYYYY